MAQVKESTTKFVPLEHLFGNPERGGASLSPDGTKLAYTAAVDGVMNVWVKDLDDSGDGRAVTKSTTRPIGSFSWTRDNRHILYLQDAGGNENHHVYLVNLDSDEVRDLTPFDNVQARILATSHRHPNFVLLGINKENPELHDAYRVDLTTGDVELVATNPGFGAIMNNWIVDEDLQPRAGGKPLPDGRVHIMARSDDSEDWRLVFEIPAEDGISTLVLGFTADGKGLLIVGSVGSNTAQLTQLDLASGKQTVIASDDEYDVSFGVRRHPTTREIQTVTVVRDRSEIKAIDPSVAGDLEKLKAYEPNSELGIGGGDVSDRKWLVVYGRDNGPALTCLYDRDTGKITELFENRPYLRDYQLASMEPFNFTSRDGLKIHGYLTFPEGAGRENLPTVLHVHGGPWGARHFWGWNSEAQWLANRGYLCVEVDYRGSGGYGKDFINASNQEWAGRMHDDLLDAIEYIVEKGYADRSRIGIYGGSYGGYAALVGATFTPDTFACSIAIVGPSNLITQVANIPPYWKPWASIWYTRLGHPVRDKDFLWSRSPLSRVDDIKCPMLIAQGANDPRVTRVESDQIVDAMKKKGIPHKYMVFDDEGHGFARPENKMKFQRQAELFLAEHLGGRSE